MNKDKATKGEPRGNFLNTTCKPEKGVFEHNLNIQQAKSPITCILKNHPKLK